MVSFVAAFCKKLLTDFSPEELYKVDIVVPSQRIALHIKKELANTLLQPVFLPNIKTINVFIGEFYKQKPIDSLSALFELYQSYCKVFKNPDSFDTFLSWGNQILSDFNDIDKYLLDEKNVFGNLKSIKEIESWSFNSEELSETQKKFLLFWEQLGELYTVYNQDLSEKGLCTVSKMYKEIANEPYRYFKDFKQSKVYFLAFNALSKSEEQLFKYFTKSGMGECVWDVDAYYLNNIQQEAGLFIRKYKEWSTISEEVLSTNLLKSEKNIELLAAKSNLDQVNYISKIISENQAFNQRNSAVVFADESLLRPFLNVIPENIERMNVAMGYPLSQSYSFTLLDVLFKTLKSITRYRNKKHLYYKDFELLFKNEMVQTFLKYKKCDLTNLVRKVQQYNYTYIPQAFIEEHLGETTQLFNFVFYNEKQTIAETLTSIIELFQEIRQSYLALNTDVIEREALYKLLLDLDKVKEYLAEFPYLETVEGLRIITSSILRAETISFFGEPLQGLQVLGLLETRGLDFENVVLVSCNEDILPKSSFSDSLMPNDLRVYFGLPTKIEKDAIFAYYFYRLIQRAKNVYLLYNNGLSEKLSSNEKSRYLLQLAKELPEVNSSIKITEKSFDFERNALLNNDSIIIKDAAYFERVDAYLKSGISVSAINKYVECPKDFYVKYLLRISEEKEIEETIELSTYGTIIHEVLEELYRMYSPLITQDSIVQMLKEHSEVLEKVFLKYFPGENYKEGKNYLQYRLAAHTVQSFLKKEKESIEANGAIKIIGLEENYSFSLKVMTKQGEKEVVLKGNFDRIDQLSDAVRIIDYKTGNVAKADLKLNLEELDKKPKALQLLFYQYLYYKDISKVNPNTQIGDKVTCGMYSLKKLNQGLVELEWEKNDLETLNQNCFDALESYLINWIEELYDTESIIIHNPKAKYCEFCS
jgi:ATP-dependent helicase/nuclease subunit B